MFNAPKSVDMPSTTMVHGSEANTVIAHGVKVEGDLLSQGGVVIEGEVVGTLQCAGLLTVGPEAKINANINAQEAVISGTVDGNMIVIKRLELKSTAKITGDITAEIIAVDNGAVISGRMSIGNKVTASQKPQAMPKKEGRTSGTTGFEV